MYALERSTEDIAFDPPKAKKVMYCESRDVMVNSIPVMSIDARISNCILKIRKRGTFVALDCVIRKSVSASWNMAFDADVSS